MSLREQSDTVRRDALEEAAKVADRFNVTPAFDLPCTPFDRTEAIADEIRKLAQRES